MPARDAFSDDDILRALRAAVVICGEPLSHSAYDRVSRDVGGPTSSRIIQRFGSWRQACDQADVRSCAASRVYQQRWDQQAVIAAVRGYLAEDGCAGTFSDYAAWAAGHQDRPSGATVRNVLGGWSAAKSQALTP